MIPALSRIPLPRALTTVTRPALQHFDQTHHARPEIGQQIQLIGVVGIDPVQHHVDPVSGCSTTASTACHRGPLSQHFPPAGNPTQILDRPGRILFRSGCRGWAPQPPDLRRPRVWHRSAPAATSARTVMPGATRPVRTGQEQRARRPDGRPAHTRLPPVPAANPD